MMICPKCEAEYREGFTTCSDCGVNLVKNNLKQPKQINWFNINDASEVLYSPNLGEIAFIKSLLSSENIGYKFFDETTMGKMLGGIRARLFINNSDLEKALELLKSANLS